MGRGSLLVIVLSVLSLHQHVQAKNRVSDVVESTVEGLRVGLARLEIADITVSSKKTNSSYCDNQLSAAHRRLTSLSSCSTLFAAISDEASPEMVESWCANLCWNSITTELTGASAIGCLKKVDTSSLGLVCSECSLTQPKLCVQEWLKDSCEKIPQGCGDSVFCLFKASAKCSGEQGDDEPRDNQDNSPKEPPAIPIVVVSNHTTNKTHTPTGLHCPNNCSYHGKCERVSNDSNEGRCVCDKLFGRTKHNALWDCSEKTLDLCPNMCHGHGVCVPDENSQMVCSCFQGFEGESCDRWSRCKALSFCGGHGKCSKSGIHPDQEECKCEPGYSGRHCEIHQSSCVDNCSARGSCIRHENGTFSCECEEGYTGVTCNKVVPQCPNNCSGAGYCQSNSTCSCQEGLVGDDCSLVETNCGNCNHGYCSNGTCQCEIGYKGEDCEIYDVLLDTNCINLNFCYGMGMCNKNITTGSYQCSCFEGFTGPECNIVDVNYENQCPNYCSGNGECVLLSTPHCSCKEGWEGADCSKPKCPKNNDIVCSGRGVCEKNPAGEHKCSCADGYLSEALGACEASLCPNDCSGNGKCKSSGTCDCNKGFTGLDCSVPSTNSEDNGKSEQNQQDSGEASSAGGCKNKCSNHGDCVKGKCVCYSGHSGDDCSVEVQSQFDDQDDLDKLDLLEINAQGEEDMAQLWN